MTLAVLLVLSQLDARCTRPDPPDLSPDAGYAALFDATWARVLAEPEAVVLRGHSPPFPEQVGELSAAWTKPLLRVNQRERVSAVVTSPSSFIVPAPLVCPPGVMWGMEPLCGTFSPTLSVSFRRGGRALSLYMCFDCELVVVVRSVGGETTRTGWVRMGSAAFWRRTFTRLAR